MALYWHGFKVKVVYNTHGQTFIKVIALQFRATTVVLSNISVSNETWILHSQWVID